MMDTRRKDEMSDSFTYKTATLHHADAFTLLASLPDNSVTATITDPPYGLVEYKPDQLEKMRAGHGGVWRLPPVLDGVKRRPLPRFTTLTNKDRETMRRFFEDLARELVRVMVPGGNVLVASNPLVSHLVADSMERGGLEVRGQIVRLVQTLRGGDRPKNAEHDWQDVSVMPRAQFEPWVMLRKSPEGTIAHNLETYNAGGWRRYEDAPFGDVLRAPVARGREREISEHPSLKPQALMRTLVLASLPCGEGLVLDPFAGSGSTLAAAAALGFEAVGCEIDDDYYEAACESIPQLAEL